MDDEKERINVTWMKSNDRNIYVTLEHKRSVKSLEYICSNSQKYIEWVKSINFLLWQKSLGH